MRTPSIATSELSEVTVTSPHRPLSAAPASTVGWHNSDYPLRAQAVRMAQPTARPAPAAPSVTAAPQQPAPIASVKRRLVALAGVLMTSVGTVGGLISIAALGPLGLAVAGGFLLGGLALIGISANLK